MLTAELDRTRRIGVEHEMWIPLVGRGSGHDVQEHLATILTANGIRAVARPYSHSPLPANVDMAVETDSSVLGTPVYQSVTTYPIELKTRPVTYDEYEAIVPKALSICTWMGARVNASCGYHVHLSFDEVQSDVRSVRSLWNLFHRFDQVIFGLVAPSRRNNHYCRHLPEASNVLRRATSLRSLQRLLAPYDRYYGLNLTNLFQDAPHIEIRHSQATLDPTRARHWVRFCLQMVSHATRRTCQAAPAPLPNDRSSLEKLLVTCGFKVNTRVYAKVTPELRETGKFLLARWKHFNQPLGKAAPENKNEEDAACAALLA